MAGSRKAMRYITDDGDNFIIQMDESNGESVGNPDFTSAVINPATELPGLPSGITPRTARYQSDDGRVSKEIIIGTRALLDVLPTAISAFFPTSSTNITVVSLTLKSITNERLKAYTGNDTGLNDGDLT